MYLDFRPKILTPKKYTKKVHQKIYTKKYTKKSTPKIHQKVHQKSTPKKYTKKSTPKIFFNTKNFFSTPKSTPNFGVTPKFSKKNTRNDHQKKTLLNK